MDVPGVEGQGRPCLLITFFARASLLDTQKNAVNEPISLSMARV